MPSRRLRPLFIAVGAVILIWLCSWAGFAISRHSKMTEEKIRQYMSSIDFAKLSAADRAKALKDLANKLNAMSREDREKARLDRLWRPWFAAMTEDEKETFINATLPNDVKQMINSFEKLGPEKRKKIIDDAMRNLKKERKDRSTNQPGDSDLASNDPNANTNAPVALSPELEDKARSLGLKTFFSESSPETKAEMAPLLEEVQRQMENGRAIRRND